MKIRSFSGGIHIAQFKEFTYNNLVKKVMPIRDQEMIYPMSQHIGEPCVPIVKIGESVFEGQKIADSNFFISSPIHSSVSGTVIDIRDILMPSGFNCKAVVVKSDGMQNPGGLMHIEREINRLSKECILEKIKDAGIVGLGGAGFPTHIKLNPPSDKKIDYIIANGAECEPYLISDHSLMLEQADKLIEGLRIIMSLHKGAKGIIAVESNKPDVIRLLESKCRDILNIEIAVLSTKYPQGSERQIVYSCIGREVPLNGFPMDVCCIVINVATIAAIHDAVLRSRPLLSRIVTINGNSVVKNGSYRVLLGTQLKDLLDATDNSNIDSTCKIISGGPMMGQAIFDINTPVVKTSSAFLFFEKQQSEALPEQACIRCGRCVSVCPMDLMPLFLNMDVYNDNIERFKKGRGSDCIECGSCSYVCPSGRHLVQSISVGKTS